MTEQSIRDDMSEELFKMYDHGTQPNAYVEADYLLASPVVRRIQAEAWELGCAAGWYDGAMANTAGLDKESPNPYRDEP